MFYIVATSVRGPKYLVGGKSVHALDSVEPFESGARFENLAQAKRYVREEMTNLSSYWRVAVVGKDGAVVATATRSGFNASGKRWLWT